MIAKEKLPKTLTIGFLNQNEKNLEVYNRYFDIVLTGKEACFQEVEKIIRREEVT